MACSMILTGTAFESVRVVQTTEPATGVGAVYTILIAATDTPMNGEFRLSI